MKKFIFIVTALAASFVLVSCKTNENQRCLTVITENGAFTVSYDSWTTVIEEVSYPLDLRLESNLTEPEDVHVKDESHLSESTEWSWGEPILIDQLDRMVDYHFVSPYKVVHSCEYYIHIIGTEETFKRSVLFVEKETSQGVISGFITKDFDHDGNVISESHQRYL